MEGDTLEIVVTFVQNICFGIQWGLQAAMCCNKLQVTIHPMPIHLAWLTCCHIAPTDRSMVTVWWSSRMRSAAHRVCR